MSRFAADKECPSHQRESGEHDGAGAEIKMDTASDVDEIEKRLAVASEQVLLVAGTCR